MNKCLVILALGVAALGCVSEPPPYIPQVNTFSGIVIDSQAPVNYTAEVADTISNSCLPIKEIIHRQTNDGYEKVETTVHNLSAQALRIRYRYIWKDESGATVQDVDVSSWEKLTIQSGSMQVLSSIAPDRRCKSFVLSVKNIVE